MKVDKVKIVNSTARWILPVVLVFFLSTSNFTHEEEQSASCYHVKSSPTRILANVADDKHTVHLAQPYRLKYGSAIATLGLPARSFSLLVNHIVSQAFRDYIRMNGP